MSKLSVILIFLLSCFTTTALSQTPTFVKCPLGANETEVVVGGFLLCVKTEEIPLVESTNLVTIKTYTRFKTNWTFDRTFVVVHNNEQKGLAATKVVIAEHGGRLVEVVSNSPTHRTINDPVNDDEHRFLFFGENKEYCIDPNRIYSADGFNLWLDEPSPGSYCTKIAQDRKSAEFKKVLEFGNALRKKIEGKGVSFIIGVHNNNGTSVKDWYGVGDEAHRAGNVSLKDPVSRDPVKPYNNFVLVSNRKLFNQLTANPICCYVALQLEVAAGLRKKKRNDKLIDDGSMSIFYGRSPNFAYINIEAYGKPNHVSTTEFDNKKWQKSVVERALTLRCK